MDSVQRSMSSSTSRFSGLNDTVRSRFGTSGLGGGAAGASSSSSTSYSSYGGSSLSSIRAQTARR